MFRASEMETPLVQETSSGAVPLDLDTLGFPQANDKFSLYAAKFPCRAFFLGNRCFTSTIQSDYLETKSTLAIQGVFRFARHQRQQEANTKGNEAPDIKIPDGLA
jgi:hypothetical protein